jgi:hypothetical protein
MINTLFGRIAPAVLLLSAFSPALAGEVGVTNSWSHGLRTGSGTSQTTVRSQRQESGSATNSAFKVEHGVLQPSSGLGTYFAGAYSTGSSKYSESQSAKYSENSKFNFSDENGSHSVSAFSN